MKKRNAFLLALYIFISFQAICQRLPAAWNDYQIDSARIILQQDVNFLMDTLDFPFTEVFVRPSYEVSAFGAVIRNGQRILLFNPAFVQKFSSESRPYWFYWVCLLHELFHIKLGHCDFSSYERTCEESWDDELACDTGAAKCLRQLGFSLAMTVYAPKVLLQSLTGSCSHPDKRTRIEKMVIAWWDEEIFLSLQKK